MNDDKKIAQATQDIRNALSDNRKLVAMAYKKIVTSQAWKDTMAAERAAKFASRGIKKTRIKKYIIPEILAAANPQYWNEAIKDHKYMKRHHSHLII